MSLLVAISTLVACSGGPQVTVAAADDPVADPAPPAEGAPAPPAEAPPPADLAAPQGPRVEITAAGMSINGELLPSQPTYDQLVRHLGEPSRSDPRANIVHIYDELGIVMLQPHDRPDIIEISFYYARMEVDFQPANLFAGTVTLLGQPLNGALHVTELPSRYPTLPFDTDYTLSAVVNPSVEVFFRERPAGDKLGRISVDFPH